MLRTRLTLLTIVTLLAAFWACSFADAQQPPRRGGFGRGFGMPGGDRLMLLRHEKVQAELELVEEQKSQLQEIGDKARTEMQGLFAALQGLSEEERGKKLEELAEKGKAIQKQVEEVLLPHQLDRLKQIGWQVRGASALVDAEVAQALELTDDQKQKLADIQQESFREMRELFQAGGGGDREAARQKMAELQRASSEKMMAVLTTDQQEKFEELKGEKFEAAEEVRGAAFGGFPRGGRPRRQQPNE